jgi:hypothetical protein
MLCGLSVPLEHYNWRVFMKDFIQNIKTHKLLHFLEKAAMAAIVGFFLLPYGFAPDLVVMPVVTFFMFSFVALFGLLFYILMDSILPKQKRKNLLRTTLCVVIPAILAVAITYTHGFKILKNTHNMFYGPHDPMIENILSAKDIGKAAETNMER